MTFARLVPRLNPETDYTVDEKTRTVSLTQEGIGKLEQWLKITNLYASENYHLVHYIENGLRAHVLYKRDKDYVVKEREVIIVDEFTGRLQFGRRYAEGLHQAIEAKEGVRIQRESITYATITLQNYFRMYKKLAGMTGTAKTEEEEFFKIYGLEVAVVPTNKPMIRADHSDLVYATQEAKWRAIVKDIEESYKKGRPVLVGTTSIENSEKLSQMLTRKGLPHQVLNAKHHEREAIIVAQAGRPGAVTVATNMAGRGTDIILGGNPTGLEITQEQWQKDHDFVVSLGGLHVIGTEHHEARRIDNQLRGRSGRQGDPGSSRFYAALTDDIMRRFGGDRIKGLMQWAGLGEDTPIENRMVTKAIENAQVKVESYHFDIRKHLLEYDDVLNKQREIIYTERRKCLEGADLRANMLEMVSQEIGRLVSVHLPTKERSTWNLEGLLAEVKTLFPLRKELASEDELQKLGREEIEQRLLAHNEEIYAQRELETSTDNMRLLERLVLLRTIDVHWVHHLTGMENLRTGIGLHAYGQRDPLVMYKTEGHRMFQELLDRIREQVTRSIYHVALAPAVVTKTATPKQNPQQSPMAAMARQREKVAVGAHKVGRNEPCPCGSGKKYKKCHGANT
jgi:preprotein translocase subunit SecA